MRCGAMVWNYWRRSGIRCGVVAWNYWRGGGVMARTYRRGGEIRRGAMGGGGCNEMWSYGM